MIEIAWIAVVGRDTVYNLVKKAVAEAWFYTI
jgi:hypothetical protein